MRIAMRRWGGRISCWYYQRWISPYLDGELDPRRRAQLERHMHRCSRCRTEYEKMLFASRLISQVGLPDEVPLRILAHSPFPVPSAARTGRMRRRHLLWSAAAVGVALLMAAFAGFLPRWWSEDESPPRKEAPPSSVPLQEITLKVIQGGCDNTGFCCARDEKKLARAIQKVPGVHRCELNKGRKEVVIAYERGRVKLEDLQQAAEKVGFKVVSLKSLESH